MTRNLPLALLVAVLLLFAGCVTEPVDDLPDDAVRLAADEAVLADLEAFLEAEPDHDHTRADAHAGFSFNADEVAHLWLDEDGAERASVGELDVRDGYAFAATFNPQAGFVILDLQDPAAPELVGRYDAGTAYAADVKATDDARWAFVATEPEGLFRGTGQKLVDYLGEELGPDGVKGAGDLGLQVVDLSDKTDPRLVAVHAADPLGYHMIDLMEIDGDLYVFGAVLPLGRVDILRFEESPHPHLVPVSTYQHPDAQDPERNFLVADISDAVLVHDMTAGPDPLDGSPLLTVSYWTLGAHLVDISDPSEPTLLGVWDDFVEAPWGNAHTAKVTRVEDRRVLVVSPEYRGLEEQGVIWIADVTDPAAPETLGTWSLPGHHPFDHTYKFSPHNFELFDGKIFLAHFHAGAYVLDIGTLEKARDPPVLAIAVPEGVGPIDAPTLPSTPTPLVWDAIPYGDHYLLSDITGGLRVFRLAPWSAPAHGTAPPALLP